MFAGVGCTWPPSIEKTVCSAYSGLVPMSPNTTPSAAMVATAIGASGRRRGARRAGGGFAARLVRGALCPLRLIVAVTPPWSNPSHQGPVQMRQAGIKIPSSLEPVADSRLGADLRRLAVARLDLASQVGDVRS